jgi:hypothetical protein
MDFMCNFKEIVGETLLKVTKVGNRRDYGKIERNQLDYSIPRFRVNPLRSSITRRPLRAYTQK